MLLISCSPCAATIFLLQGWLQGTSQGWVICAEMTACNLVSIRSLYDRVTTQKHNRITGTECCYPQTGNAWTLRTKCIWPWWLRLVISKFACACGSRIYVCSGGRGVQWWWPHEAATPLGHPGHPPSEGASAYKKGHIQLLTYPSIELNALPQEGVPIDPQAGELLLPSRLQAPTKTWRSVAEPATRSRSQSS